MTTLSSQIVAYEEMRDVLEVDHFGKWVVFYDEDLIDTYESSEEAAVDAVRRFGRGPYLIRQVGAPPVRLPASVWYRPANANN
jgi:hypothetical protein